MDQPAHLVLLPLGNSDDERRGNLDAYGAATWGQFFIYQGFNPDTGWMHTSTGADAVDEFAETIVRKNGKLFYRYGAELRPIQTSVITVPYRAADGSMQSKTFTVYRTHHGPIIRTEGDKWIAFAMMYKPVEALEQSYLRTKTHDLAEFLKVAELKANSSNNTLFADSKGEIAYLHPQFVPLRDNRFDYTKPVDGSDPATDWKGLTPLAKLPQAIKPKSGWIENTNNAPWTASAPADSPEASGLSALHGYGGRHATPRTSCGAGAERSQGFLPWIQAPRCKLRTLPSWASPNCCPICSPTTTGCPQATR